MNRSSLKGPSLPFLDRAGLVVAVRLVAVHLEAVAQRVDVRKSRTAGFAAAHCSDGHNIHDFHQKNSHVD